VARGKCAALRVHGLKDGASLAAKPSKRLGGAEPESPESLESGRKGKAIAANRGSSFEESLMRRHLLVISRREPLTYETMKQSFAGHSGIEVIVDRRRRERRRQTIPIEVNRRAGERRATNIDALLAQLGWVIVEQRTGEV